MKYMGSKSRIKKEILPIIQKYINDFNVDTYIEPFCGGCNVIDDVDCEFKFANDLDSYISGLLHEVAEDGPYILPLEITKEHYDDVRECWRNDTSKYPTWYIGAVGYLASYNGRFFDGGYAKPVVSKSGKVRNYYDEARRNLAAQAEKLKPIEITQGHYKEFSDLDSGPLEGVMLYCDIPYKNTKQYHVSKNFDYSEFWQWAREMSEKNIVLISELEAPDDFVCIWEQDVVRTQNNRDRSISTEKLFIHSKGYGYSGADSNNSNISQVLISKPDYSDFKQLSFF